MTSHNFSTQTNTLFLGDLSVTSTANDVIIAIGDQGIRDVEVKMCYRNGKQCTYCVVIFSSVENCQEAYERLQGGFAVHASPVRVRYGDHQIADVAQDDVSVHSGSRPLKRTLITHMGSSKRVKSATP